MFRYNPSPNYQPNGGRYLQILSGKDLYNQMMVVSSDDNFHARFPNIFVDYPLESMPVGDKLWMNWNKVPLRLWQTILKFAMWCTSSACGVSSEHLNYAKHPLVRSPYRFHIYRPRRCLQRRRNIISNACTCVCVCACTRHCGTICGRTRQEMHRERDLAVSC